MFAGKSLADIQAVLDATPEARWDVTTQAVVATLTERIGRDNARPSSVKRAQAALDLLMSEGRVLKVKPVRTESAPASVPAPESSPLPVAISIPRPGSAPAATVPAAPKPAPKPAARTSGSQKAAQDIITIGKAHGKSIPRWLSAVAAGRPVK